MMEVCADLLDEYAELASLAGTLAEDQWRAPTPFHAWTPWDEIAHLCFFDEEALTAVTDPEQFGLAAKALVGKLASGLEISRITRERYGRMGGEALLACWCERYPMLVQALSRLDAATRLPWYGPAMRARSFAAARIMETWAHGQDIYDALGRKRPVGPRLWHVAQIGVATFGWSFANRGLAVPDRIPYVELGLPDGRTWRWNDPESPEQVKGSAEAFCLVVTQRRNVADTALEVRGEHARQWMQIAQCFAGPPVDGPRPGVRKQPVGDGTA